MNVFSRIFDYARRNGVAATVSRIATGLKRARSGSWMVVYACDLPEIARAAPATLDVPIQISRCERQDEVPEVALEKILSIGHCGSIEERIHERFDRGASLWLVWNSGELAGFGWTMVGSTIEPHYFPVLPNDVHLFDFFVFPEHRGRGLNPVLVNYILCQASAAQKRRALIEAARWNTPQLHSLKKTPFRRIGLAKKRFSRNSISVVWEQDSNVIIQKEIKNA